MVLYHLSSKLVLSCKALLVYINIKINTKPNLKTIDTLHFLMRYGVNVRNTFDALNIALLYVNNSKTAILYCKLLIEIGHGIYDSHVKQIELLKIENYVRYIELVGEMPQLESL